MAKNSILTTLRYLLHAAREVYDAWFTPYHSDEEGEPEEAPKAAPAEAGKPGTSPAPPVQTVAAAAAAPAEAATPAEASPPVEEPPVSPDVTPEEAAGEIEPAPASAESAPAPEGTFDQFEVLKVMAFRGCLTRESLADALNATREGVAAALQILLDEGLVEHVGDGRYLLSDVERRRILEAHEHTSPWLARLGHADLRQGVLDLFERLCRQLPIKVLAGQNLVFHLRQKKWMIWQAEEGTCFVRVFGTLRPEHRTRMRRLDRRARLSRRKEPHDWDVRDRAAFRWTAETDAAEIEALLGDVARDFLSNLRRPRGRKRNAPPQEPAAASKE